MNAIWLASDEVEEPGAAMLPAGVSHLLAADDALSPGRWVLIAPTRDSNGVAVCCWESSQ
ncbi:MAG: hypothetical protein ACRDS9_10390 [Pseudonocardiaceae bacterium]